MQDVSAVEGETRTYASLRRFGVVSSSKPVQMRFLRGDTCSEVYNDSEVNGNR